MQVHVSKCMHDYGDETKIEYQSDVCLRTEGKARPDLNIRTIN